MLRVNILSNDKDIIIKLPKSSHEMAAELRKAGIDISPERLTLKSNVGHNYLIGLYTEDPLGDVVIDRICDNDNLAELNKLCQVLDESSDRDNMMRCGRPQILQRLYSLVENLALRCCLIFIAVLAMNQFLLLLCEWHVE